MPTAASRFFLRSSGKIPEQTDQSIAELEEKIRQEAYEDVAVLRDRIQELSRKIPDAGSES